MIPLVLGPDERARLADLTTRAAASPTDYATMQQMARAALDPQNAERLRAMNRALTIEIPTAFTVTLTHEEHKPGVMCRHVSIGCRATSGRGPSPEAVAMILGALGWVNALGVCPAWIERLDDGSAAINLVEPLDGDLNKLRETTTPKDGRQPA